MRVSCRWLAEYVELGLDERPVTTLGEELGERLTLAGLEVEDTWRVGPAEGLVVGRVMSVEAHPNADHLSVCEVDVGAEALTILCGAPNVACDQIVPVVRPGGLLPGGARIDARKLRGIVSHGMICSKAELGLEDTSPGIWAFSPGANLAPGDDLVSQLEFDDLVLDVSITSNRPDLLAVYGIAREISALLRRPLRPLDLSLEEIDPPSDQLVAVAIENPADAPRYSARLLSGITVGPSPLWLQHRLAKAGMRPLTNVVDVTNYVMLELGHPLHPFDADVVGSRIEVRRAKAGERFRTLDGVDRTLGDRVLMIADECEALALAGIMGGERSEIRASTTRVLLEAATFHHALVRHAGRALGLRTEASQRFGRGLDPEGVEVASARAAHWMQKLCGGRVHRGCADAYPQPTEPGKLTLRPERIEQLLGVSVPEQEATDILEHLGIACASANGRIEATVPTWRRDLTREADLIEEVGRIFGYDRVPSRAPRALVRRGSKDGVERFKDRIRKLLVGLGMDEVVGDGFDRGVWREAIGLSADDRVLLRNPMQDNQTALRTALLPGLLATIEWNENQGVDGGQLFEIGRVFTTAAGERDAVGGAFFGRAGLPMSGKSDVTLSHAKGVLFSLLEALRIHEPAITPSEAPGFLAAGRGGTVAGNGQRMGWFGVLGEAVTRELPLTSEVYAFELDVATLQSAASAQAPFSPLPRYPACKRDLSIIAPVNVPERRIREAIATEPEVERLLLYDTYRGDQVAAGHKSLTYELVLRATDHTLTDEEVAPILARIESRLATSGIRLRR